MNKYSFNKCLLSVVVGSLLFTACGDDSSSASNEDDVVAVKDKNVSGFSQKGPFVTGSSVEIYELDDNFKQTGNSFTGTIEKDDGSFAVDVVELSSQYVLLKANGYYRNEVTGENSTGTITLNALTDLSDREKVNVNLLTHLEYERAMYLVKNDSMSVSDAKAQAEKEVFKAFGFDGKFASSEDLNIFGEGEGSGALLSISILMQGDRTEAALTELLKKFAGDIKEDGSWDDEATKASIADWALSAESSGILDSVSKNVSAWKLGNVPEFKKHVHKFWTDVYGLETCNEKSEGQVVSVKNKNSENFNSKTRLICKDGSWNVASDLEKDTYGWSAPESLSGMALVKQGSVTSELMYVYDVNGKKWREITEMESRMQSTGDSVSYPGSWYFRNGVVKEYAVCYPDIEGASIYVAKKVNGKYFNGDYFNGDVEYPALGNAGSNLDNGIINGRSWNNLQVYECSNYEWKKVEDLMAFETKGLNYTKEKDGELYFAPISLNWYKFDAKNGWSLADSYDVHFHILQKDSKISLPLLINDDKKTAPIRDAVGSGWESGWMVDETTIAQNYVNVAGCTETRMGEIIYVDDPLSSPYTWVKFYRCDELGKTGSKVYGWEFIDDVDFDGVSCSKTNVDEIRLGNISKIIQYRCEQSPNDKEYYWMLYGVLGEAYLQNYGAVCDESKLGERRYGDLNSKIQYECALYAPEYYDFSRIYRYDYEWMSLDYIWVRVE